MKLTNEDKANNATVASGIKVLRNKLTKLGEEREHEEETIRLNTPFRDRKEVANARCVVAECNVKLINSIITQLKKCIAILEETKV